MLRLPCCWLLLLGMAHPLLLPLVCAVRLLLCRSCCGLAHMKQVLGLLAGDAPGCQHSVSGRFGATVGSGSSQQVSTQAYHHGWPGPLLWLRIRLPRLVLLLLRLLPQQLQRAPIFLARSRRHGLLLLLLLWWRWRLRWCWRLLPLLLLRWRRQMLLLLLLRWPRWLLLLLLASLWHRAGTCGSSWCRRRALRRSCRLLHAGRLLCQGQPLRCLLGSLRHGCMLLGTHVWRWLLRLGCNANCDAGWWPRLPLLRQLPERLCMLGLLRGTLHLQLHCLLLSYCGCQLRLLMSCLLLSGCGRQPRLLLRGGNLLRGGGGQLLLHVPVDDVAEERSPCALLLNALQPCTSNEECPEGRS